MENNKLIMARGIKSLLFNYKYGTDIKRHRDHRSKRGRNRWNKNNTPEYFKYKKKKFKEKYENEDEYLLF